MIRRLIEKLVGSKPAPAGPVGRNEPCPCGSGRKYKRCCLDRDEAELREQRHDAIAAASNDPDFAGGQASVANRALERANRYPK